MCLLQKSLNLKKCKSLHSCFEKLRVKVAITQAQPKSLCLGIYLFWKLHLHRTFHIFTALMQISWTTFTNIFSMSKYDVEITALKCWFLIIIFNHKQVLCSYLQTCRCEVEKWRQFSATDESSVWIPKFIEVWMCTRFYWRNTPWRSVL